MLISTEKKFVFIANTKTASTSIEHALMDYAEIHRGGSPARKHIGLYQAYNIYNFLFSQPDHTPDQYFKFGVMRDPLDWIGSWYRYRKGNNVESPLPRGMDFEAFWERKDWNIMRPDGWKYLQRHLFCAPQGGEVLADVIIPYHKVGEEFGKICDAFGIESPLPRKNVSELRDAGFIPAHLEDEMRDFYDADYRLWNRLDEINAVGMEKLMAMTGAKA
jgi:hypothetical protein